MAASKSGWTASPLLTARLGLKPGDRLAMSVGNRFEFIEIMYGAMRAGVVPVPLSTRLGADVLEYIVKDAGCVAAVVEPAANPAFVEVVDKLGLKTRLGLGSVAGGLARLRERAAGDAGRLRSAEASRAITPPSSPIPPAPPAGPRA